jgi:hypothetical protein
MMGAKEGDIFRSELLHRSLSMALKASPNSPNIMRGTVAQVRMMAEPFLVQGIDASAEIKPSRNQHSNPTLAEEYNVYRVIHIAFLALQDFDFRSLAAVQPLESSRHEVTHSKPIKLSCFYMVAESLENFVTGKLLLLAPAQQDPLL